MQQNNLTNELANESFEELFKQTTSSAPFEENVVKGVVVGVDKSYIIVDVGLKSEGKIPISEFADKEGNKPTLNIGDEVEVFIERYEDLSGVVCLSREKAKREEIWKELEECCKNAVPVTGYVVKKVKGGFAVMIDNTQAFLPGSQLDNRPMKNVNSLINTNQTLLILKMDKKRYNIVVSRKAVLENSDVQEQELNIEEGQIVEGTVKNITGYGAFIDLGNVDGLLHLTDMSWSRVSHPAEILQLHQTIKLKVIKIHPESKRLSLGLKQLEQDPWKQIEDNYHVDQVCDVVVTNIVEYGAFCQIIKGVEGLVHVSEVSWLKKDIIPSNYFNLGETIRVKIIQIDVKKRRVNLSIKQCLESPWVGYSEKHPEGSVINVEITDINDHGLVVKIEKDLEGFIKLFDLAWDAKSKDKIKEYSIGDKIDCKILKYDLEKDKIVLSVKHLMDDPFNALEGMKRGTIVSTEIVEITEDGLVVKLDNKDISAFISKEEVALEREDQDLQAFSVGEKVEAMVTSVYGSNRNINLSIKALELSEQKKLLSSANVTSTSSFADVLTEAMHKGSKK